MQEPSNFHQFCYLPKEIRLQIWSKLIPPPRIIQLSPRENKYNSPLVSLTKPPILLSINHESRTLGLSTYSFLPIRNMRIPISRIEDTVYVSFAQLHYSYTPFTNLLTAVASLIRYFPVSSLGLDYRCWDRMCGDHNLISILAGMPHLRGVKMVFEFRQDLEGVLGFLDIQEWRGGLRQKAGLVEENIRDERRKLSEMKRYADVEVRCVDLTKGGKRT